MRKVLVLAAVAAVSVLSGCASFDVQDMQDRLGVQVATMAYIEAGDSHVKRAERVLEVVKETRTLVDFADFSVADVEVALLARIAQRQLTPLEEVAAKELVVHLAREVDAQLSRRAVTADQRVTVNEVLDLVEFAASRYVQK